MLAAPAAAMARAPGGGAQPSFLLHDRRIAGVAEAVRRAELLGIAAVATGGEIAALLHATPFSRLTAGGRTVAGLTGWSETMLAADIARAQGSRVRLLGQDADTPWMLHLRPQQKPSGIFAWLASARA